MKNTKEECDCSRYVGVPGDVCKGYISARCALPYGHGGDHRRDEVSWCNTFAPATPSSAGEECDKCKRLTDVLQRAIAAKGNAADRAYAAEARAVAAEAKLQAEQAEHLGAIALLAQAGKAREEAEAACAEMREALRNIARQTGEMSRDVYASARDIAAAHRQALAALASDAGRALLDERIKRLEKIEHAAHGLRRAWARGSQPTVYEWDALWTALDATKETPDDRT